MVMTGLTQLVSQGTHRSGARPARPLFFRECYGDHRDLHSFPTRRSSDLVPGGPGAGAWRCAAPCAWSRTRGSARSRSEEHTSELQSLRHLVCRLLLEKKKENTTVIPNA